MGLMDTLFAVARDRRGKQIEELKAQRAQVERDFAAAGLQGDDAKQDKLYAERVKLDAKIEAAEAAVAESQRQAELSAARAAAEEQARKERDARAAIEAAYRQAAEFERVVMSAVDVWLAYRKSDDEARALIREARMDHVGLTYGKVWDRVLLRFVSAIQEPDRAPLLLPVGGSRGWDAKHEPLADVIEREIEALNRPAKPTPSALLTD